MHVNTHTTHIKEMYVLIYYLLLTYFWKQKRVVLVSIQNMYMWSSPGLIT